MNAKARAILKLAHKGDRNAQWDVFFGYSYGDNGFEQDLDMADLYLTLFDLNKKKDT